MLENPVKCGLSSQLPWTDNRQFGSSDSPSGESDFSRGDRDYTRQRRLTHQTRVNPSPTDPSNFQSIREIFNTGLNSLRSLKYEGDLTICSKIRFEQPFALHISGALSLEKGGAISGLQGLKITARKVNKSAASILSGNYLDISCGRLDNSDRGLLRAQKSISISAREVDNQTGKIISSMEEITWAADELGIFDNTDGLVQARRSVIGKERAPISNGSSIFINKCGLVSLQQGEFGIQMARFFNAKGQVKAPRIHLDVAEVENAFGRLHAAESEVHAIAVNIGNFRGEIHGPRLRVDVSGKLNNCGGLLSGLDCVDLQMGTLGFDEEFQTSLEKLLSGKIVSKRGSIYLASRQPLILSDDLTAGQDIKIFARADVKNLPGAKWSAPDGLILVQSQSESDAKIELQTIQLDAKKIQITSSKGPILFNRVSARAEGEIEVEKRIEIKGSTWRVSSGDLRIVTRLNDLIQISESHFEGSGKLQLKQLRDREVNPTLILKNSQFNFETLLFRGGIVSVVKCAIVSRRLWNLTCYNYACFDTFIKSGEDLQFDSNWAIKQVRVELHGNRVDMVAAKTIYSTNVLFQSLSNIRFKTISGPLFLRGRIKSHGWFRALGTTVDLQDIKVWTRGDFLSFARKDLFANFAQIFSRGSEILLGARECVQLSDAELTAPDGKISLEAIDKIDISVVSAISLSHKIEAYSIVGCLVHQLAQNSIEHTTRRLQLRESLLEIHTPYSVTRRYFDPSGSTRAGIVALQARDSLQIMRCHLRSPLAYLQSRNLELSRSLLQHQNLQIQGNQSVSLSQTQLIGQQTDIQAPRIAGAQSIMRVDYLTLSGEKIEVKNCASVGNLLSIRAERAIHLAQLQLAQRATTFASRQKALIEKSVLSAQGNLLVAAPYLQVRGVLAKSRRALFVGSSSLIAEHFSLIAHQWSLKGGNLQMRASAIAGKVQGELHARQVQGQNIVLAVQHGDAEICAEFASFESLLAVVGGNAHLRADSLSAEACEFRIGQNLSIDACAHLALQRAFVQASNAHLKGRDLCLIDTTLHARNQLQLRGNRGLSSHSAIVGEGHLALHFSQLRVLQSILRAKNLLVQGESFRAVQSALQVSGSLLLGSQFQSIAQCSLKIGGLLQQSGLGLFGFENTLAAGAITQVAQLAIASCGERRQARWLSSQRAPLTAKPGDTDRALLILESALCLLRPQSSQKGLVLLSQAGLTDVTGSSHQALFMYAKAIWHFIGDRAQFAARSVQLEAGDRLTLKGVTAQATTFSAEAPNLVDAQHSMLSAERLSFEADEGQLKLLDARFGGGALAAKARQIAGDRLQFAARDVQLRAGDRLTLQGARGQSTAFSAEAPNLVDAQHSMLSAERLSFEADEGQLKLLDARFGGGALAAKARQIAGDRLQFAARDVQLRAGDRLTLQGARGQSTAFSAEAPDLVDAQSSLLSAQRLELWAVDGELKVADARFAGDELTAKARRIDQQRAEIITRKSRVEADESINLQDAVLEGEFELRASQILQQGGILIPHGDASLSASDWQTDAQSLLAGPGNLEVTFGNQSLYGQTSVDKKFEVRAQGHDLQNHMPMQADEVEAVVSGSATNHSDITARVGRFDTQGALLNNRSIAAEESVRLRAQRFCQGAEGSVESNITEVHQTEALRRGQIGSVTGNQLLKLMSDSDVHNDQTTQTAGDLHLVSTSQGQVISSAHLQANGNVDLQGGNVGVYQRLHSGGRANLQGANDVATSGHVTAQNGLVLEGDRVQLNAVDTDVVGRAKIKAREARIQSAILGPQEGWGGYREYDSNHPEARPYRSCQAKLRVQGPLEFEVSEINENLGGEIVVDRDTTCSGVDLMHNSLTHNYSYKQVVDYKEKFRPLYKFPYRFSFQKKVPIYEPRDQQIIDCLATSEIRGDLILNLTGDLHNDGIILAKNIRGRARNLTLALLERRGRAPKLTGAYQGTLPGTMRALQDLQLDIEEKTTVEGALQAGRDFDLLTNDLDVRKREVNEWSALVKKGGFFKSKDVQYAQTHHIEAGGIVTSGGSMRIRVKDTANFVAAEISAGQDIDILARKLNILALDEIYKVDLPGRSSAFKSRELHALHTKFHTSSFSAGGFSRIEALGHVVNEAGVIRGRKGALLIGDTVEERVRSAVNQTRSDRTLVHSSERNAVVMARPNMVSSAGDAAVRSRGDLHIRGDILAPQGVASAQSTEGSVHFHPHAQKMTQRERQVEFGFLSVTSTSAAEDRAEVAMPSVTGKNVVITAKREIRGEGAQLAALQKLTLKAQAVRLKGVEAQKKIRVRGYSVGISFAGYDILKSLADGQPGEVVAKELLRCDPALRSAFDLLRARSGEQKAYRGLKAAIATWDAANAISLAKAAGTPLSTFIGERAGLINNGGFSPQVSLNLDSFKEVREESHIYLCQLAAGEEVVIEADEQEYEGVDISGGIRTSLTGVDGGAAKSIDFKSARETLYSARESVNVGFQPGPGPGGLPFNVSGGLSEQEANQTSHVNSQLHAPHLHINAKNMRANGLEARCAIASGKIDELTLISQLDESDSREEGFSASTKGHFSNTDRSSRSRQVSRPTLFEAAVASPIEIGRAHLVGAQLHNVSPGKITAESLSELREERDHSISLNINELSRGGGLIANSLGSGRSAPTSPPISESIPEDPRGKKGFVDLGTWEWETSHQSGEYRATASGSVVRENINSDITTARITHREEHSGGGIPLAIPDFATLGLQAAFMGGKSLPELLKQESSARLQRSLKEIEALELDEDVIKARVRDLQLVAPEDVPAGNLEECARKSRAVPGVAHSESLALSIGDESGELDQRALKAIDDLKWHQAQLRDMRRAQQQIPRGSSKSEHELTRIAEREFKVKINLCRLNCHEAQIDCHRALVDCARARVRGAQSPSEHKSVTKRLNEFSEELNALQSKADRALIALAAEAGDIRKEIKAELDRIDLSPDEPTRKNHEFALEELTAQLNRLNRAHADAVSRELVREKARMFLGKDIGVREAELIDSDEKTREIETRACELLNQKGVVDSKKAIDFLAKEQGISKEVAELLFLRAQLSREKGGLKTSLDKPFDAKFANFAAFEPIWEPAGDISQMATKLPDWVDEVFARCDEMELSPRFDEHERTNLFRCQLREAFEKNSKSTGAGGANTAGFPAWMRILLRDAHQLANNQHGRARPTHYTKDGLYEGDFEKGRIWKSGRFCYKAGKSGVEASAEFRQPTNMLVMHVPGILSGVPQDYVKNADLISTSHNDKSVLTINNSSGGIVQDVQETYRISNGYITRPAVELAMSIREFTDKNPTASVHIVAHSQGCIHLKNALRMLDQETRDQLQITAVGPAAHIGSELCKNVRHFASKDDLVARFFLAGHTENVTWLDRHPEADCSSIAGDHSFTSPTVKGEIEERCRDLCKKFAILAEQLARENKGKTRMVVQASRTHRI